MLQYDHIAIGLSDAAPLLRVLTKDMGGTPLGGGVPPGSGFRFIQVHLGEPESPGMTVELLEPHLPEANDFLQRFVERHGDGPHHVTFKTDDIVRELERLKALGIDPVGINFANPDWQEMFIHPKTAHGIVVQIAQSAYGLHTPSAMVTERRARGPKVFEDRNWWGEITRGSNPVWLRRVVLGSPEPEKTTEFYATVLLGETCEPGRICWTGGEILVEESPSFGLQRLELEGDHLSIEMAGTVFRFASN
jgi:methylmalonyl-CoA/ethylmalonyl-CoA epimerase